MEDKKEIIEQTNEDINENDNSRYIEAIKNLKKDTVSKKSYDKVVEENKELLNAILNGGELKGNVESKEVESVDIKALREKLYGLKSKDLSNLEYVDTTLKLRKALMDAGQEDPFVGRGSKLSPTKDDYDTADRVAKVFEECIEYAQGDSAIFTQELQRRTINDTLPLRK